jgi:DNA topoisomerase IA
MVTERNWLEVYPYTNWATTAQLPPLQEGDTFVPGELLLKEVCVCLCHAGFQLLHP